MSKREFNWDQRIDRRGTSSLKWDACEKLVPSLDLIPLWVADMDFESPPGVKEALLRRVRHGVYGYPSLPSSLLEAIRLWLKDRYGWEIEPEWLLFSPGVVPALALSILAFSEEGDGVLIQSPVYPPFFKVIEGNRRRLLINLLQNEDGYYSIDFHDFRKKAKEAKAFILCNPHNPVGRVWKAEELEKMAEIGLENDLLIICDEIHADIVYKGNRHIPLASLGSQIAQRTITCLAPSKTFNIAGLHSSLIVVPNPQLRKVLKMQMENLGIEGINLLGIVAMEAAYSTGKEWLNSLLEYLEGSIHLINDFLREKLPEVKFFPPQGTHLAWLDFRALKNNDSLKNFLEEEGVFLSDGKTFGPGGNGFQRLNFASPRSLICEGLERIARATRKFSSA